MKFARALTARRAARLMGAHRDILALAGILLVAHGLGQLHPALAPIFVGVAFIAAVGAGRKR